MTKQIKVKFGLRQGEYGPSARFEFPHPWYIIKLLETTEIKEQKKYKFHYFNNVLVAKNFSEDLKKFLQDGMKKLGIEVEFVE